MNIFIDLERLDGRLKSGITHIVESNEYAIFTKKTNNSKEVVFKESDKNGFEVKICSNGIAEVSYERLSDAYRSITYLLGVSQSNEELLLGYKQESSFDFRCVQIEASRNGVLNSDNVKTFLRYFALMGINAVCLYTENTYEVSDESFFGYLRGGYTQKELKEFDDYACDFGIEMFPCIQTLGHLKQVLQWTHIYKDLTDTDHILLVGEEKTYDLISKMISSVSSCFRSKRIHIGMDEAHGLGSGEYKKRHGERSSFDIINEHLERVVSICKEFELNPMIWSDMYFRLGSKTNDYYDLDADIPQNVIDNIPSEIDIVYWDYYHNDEKFYETFIDKHRELNKEPIVAPGAWSWGRFWTALPFSYSTISPCLKVCRKKAVSQVFLTTWGDDGMEVDIYSALPAIQFFAELCYAEDVDRECFISNLHISCGIDLVAYEKASELDNFIKNKDGILSISNTSKWLLWDDPLIGLCEPLQHGHSFKEHYTKLFEELSKYSKSLPLQNKRLQFPAQLAKVLSIKCDVRKNLVIAYLKNDKDELKNLLKIELIPLIDELKKLWKLHRDMWLKTYKPFGLEVIERRYGGVIVRIESLLDRINDLLLGNINSIPEFETELLVFDDSSPDFLSNINSYSRIASSSVVF